MIQSCCIKYSWSKLLFFFCMKQLDIKTLFFWNNEVKSYHSFIFSLINFICKFEKENKKNTDAHLHLFVILLFKFLDCTIIQSLFDINFKKCFNFSNTWKQLF